jgi:hypothetical protein
MNQLVFLWQFHPSTIDDTTPTPQSSILNPQTGSIGHYMTSRLARHSCDGSDSKIE